MASEQESDSPGWDAIDGAFDAVYPGLKPVHIGYDPGLAFGSGLQGCSAYRAADHWHYVTYGLTELWDKNPDAEPGISGWGYEFTLRVPHRDSDSYGDGDSDDNGSGSGDEGDDPESPPRWPFVLLERLASTSNHHGTLYEIGDRIDTSAPITGEPGTDLTVLAITRDPAFPDRISTPNGEFSLLQVVGATAADLARMKATSTAAVLEERAADNPLLITDPQRATQRG